LLDNAGAGVTAALDPTTFDAVIFDLGGVILPLAYQSTILGLGALLARDAREIYQETAQEHWFDRFDLGQCSAADFRAELRQHSRNPAPISDPDIDRAWNAVLGRIPNEHLQLLRELRSQKRTFLLSNTNIIHIEQVRQDYAERHLAEFGPFSELFERDYYSHELGLRKPDRSAFLHIVEHHGLELGRTLFIDDNEHNVKAASELGLSAILHPRNAPLVPYFSK
jgi:glucose-1-phosphatase